MERLSSPTPTYRVNNLQVDFGSCAKPEKDGGSKLCRGPIPPCPDWDGGGDNGAAPSLAEASDGGAVYTPKLHEWRWWGPRHAR